MAICYFERETADGRFRCGALKIKECPAGCKFRKTEKEYIEERNKAAERLKSLGLEVVDMYDRNGVIHKTTRPKKLEGGN